MHHEAVVAPNVTSLHREAIIVDGLQVAKCFSTVGSSAPSLVGSPPNARLRAGKELFEDMRAAGLTAVHCTCSIWENLPQTMANLAAFTAWFAAHEEIIRPVRTSEDIVAAKREGRVGIILGWQNTSAIEDSLYLVPLFQELGVRIVQLTYNTQNLVGGGCLESSDRGLSDFGQEVVDELNRARILIDLSHVGPATSAEVVERSSAPVACTHAGPATLKPHARNKTDDQLRAIAAKGGVIGLYALPWFLAAGNNATVEDYVDTIEHVVDVAGEDHVAIGTDFLHGKDDPYVEWLLRDRGYARSHTSETVADIRGATMPAGLRTVRELPNVTAAMERRGWPAARIRKILGENWLRVLAEVWGR